MDIGKRLKSLRVKNDLTLEELASRTELSKGFLSQLERNLTSPSISTLQDITEVLGISLQNFFREEDLESKICFHKEDYFVDEKADRTTTWLVPNAQKNAMEPILLELQGDGESQVMDPHEGEEFGYVLQGTLLLIDVEKQKKYSLKKGESFYLKADTRHYLCSKGPGKVKVLWIVTPPTF